MRTRAVSILTIGLSCLAAAIDCSQQPKPVVTASPRQVILRTSGFVAERASESGIEYRITFSAVMGHQADHRAVEPFVIVTDGVVRESKVEGTPVLEILSRGDFHAQVPEAVANATLAPCTLMCTGTSCRCQNPTCPGLPGHVCKYVHDANNQYCTCAKP